MTRAQEGKAVCIVLKAVHSGTHLGFRQEGEWVKEEAAKEDRNSFKKSGIYYIASGKSSKGLDKSDQVL